MPDDKPNEHNEILNWYTLLDGSHSFRGVHARKGREIQLTDREANKLGNRVRRSTMADNKVTETVKPTYTPVTAVAATTDETVATTETTGTTANTATTAATTTTRDWSSTQDMKAPDVIDLINETDSKEELASLQEVEEKGQNRVGVLREIKKRMGQIGG